MVVSKEAERKPTNIEGPLRQTPMYAFCGISVGPANPGRSIPTTGFRVPHQGDFGQGRKKRKKQSLAGGSSLYLVLQEYRKKREKHERIGRERSQTCPFATKNIFSKSDQDAKRQKKARGSEVQMIANPLPFPPPPPRRRHSHGACKQ